MSYVVRCDVCGEKVYPVELSYRGDPRLRAYEVALAHVNETRPHPVDVMGGHHYVSEGEPPKEFPDRRRRREVIDCFFSRKSLLAGSERP